MATNNAIRNINHQDLNQAIKMAYIADTPLMIWGAPGIGKSTVVNTTAKQISDEHGRKFIEWNSLDTHERNQLVSSNDNSDVFIYADCRLSQYDPSDWAIPWVNKETNTMEWMSSGLLRAFSRPNTAGMMFLDELPQAMPIVQSSAYQIILDRAYKDTVFRNIRMVAAGNRTSDSGTQYAFAPALANRLTHVELMTITGQQWVKTWAVNAGIHPMICSFILHDPSQLTEKTGKTENRRFAWASPRSWEMASKLLHTLPEATAKNIDWWTDQASDMLYTSVGRGAALDFKAFMDVLHDIFLEDFLKDPAKIKELTLDRQMGVISMAISHVATVFKQGDDNKTAQVLKQLCGLAENIERGDLRALLLGGMSRATHGGDGRSRYAEIMRANRMSKEADKLLQMFVSLVQIIAGNGGR